MNKKYKYCREPLPLYALHFSNEAGIANGYCSYFCLLSALGDEKALKVVRKYLEKRVDKPQEARSPEGESIDIDKKQPNRGNSGNSEMSDTLRLILEDDPEEVGG